ncbi:hypothetical protein DL98DRAFT_599237 [Cadophora sp. DSE1049]|nr:hypothetical protein DL98DRAFT_599237 [Cadophora sp. DSE1049]
MTIENGIGGCGRLFPLVLVFLFSLHHTSGLILSNQSDEVTNDYFTGSKFTPPPYREEFEQHLDAVEAEYLEFFTQLSPVGVPPVVISPCLSNATLLLERGGLSIRKLKGWLNHKIDDILGRPPRRPVFKKYCDLTSLSIRIYYHVVASSFSGFDLVTPDQIETQHQYLNNIYGHLSINFQQIDLNYRIDSSFAVHDLNDNKLENILHPQRALGHSGDYWDLNVWIVEDLTWRKPNGSLNGYADFPDATRGNTERLYDGVVIRAGTLPGTEESIQGRTLVHEIGHWLGLHHVFDTDQKKQETCADNNIDNIMDTKQYPSNPDQIYEPMQVPCGERIAEKVINFMSYSGIRGEDGIGFTTGQKSRAFSTYLAVRRGLLNRENCQTTPVEKRDLPADILELLRQDNADCAKINYEDIVDISLQPPPDPEYPYYPVLPIEPGKRTPGPVSYPKTRPLSCLPKRTPENGLNGTCPVPCNVHSNACHRPTAQTCIYPNPHAANPRAACACRPGFRSAFDPAASAKHWRLPISGLEDYVWVAEGVECDTPCDQPYGTPSCREVTLLPKECIG